MYKQLTLKVILILVCCLSSFIIPQNVLSISDTSVNTYENFYIHISLSNNDTIIGFQFDLFFPESIDYQDSLIKHSRFTDHIITLSEIAPGRIRLICFSLTNSALRDSAGMLLSLLFNAGGETGILNILFVDRHCAVVVRLDRYGLSRFWRNGPLDGEDYP